MQMRKFFSFRSSSTSSSVNDLPDPPGPVAGKVYWEKPWQSDGEDAAGDSSGNQGSPITSSSKKCSENMGSAASHLRRSLSFSSPVPFSGAGEEYLNSFDNPNGSPSSSSNTSHHGAEYLDQYSQSHITERLPKSKRRNLAAVRKAHASEKISSPSSSKDYYGSSINSPYSSPVPLRCRTSRITQMSNRNKILNLYIDGEQQEGTLDNQRLNSSIKNDGCLAENRTLVNSGRPPRAHSTAPSSPTYSKENLRSHSFREVKDYHRSLSVQDWAASDFKPVSPHKTTKKFVQKLSHAFGRSKLKSREYDSERTTTIEDIYEDTSDPHPGLYLDESAQNFSLSDHANPCRIVNNCFSHNMLESQDQNPYIGKGPWGISNEEDREKDLLMKLKEAEERFMLLSEIDVEPEKLQNGDLCISALLQTIKDINIDRRNLALELLTQMQCRIADRSSAKEAQKQAQLDLDTRTRRLEREKNELQSSLEKELDRRSNEWSFKLEKFQAEEQRLRERVRELAEQNVSLQREVSALNGREADTRNRIVNLEMQLKDLTTRLEEVKTENQNLREILSEVQERSESAEADRDCIKRSYRLKEKENKELQKAVVRLQRICSEHEKTIAGLKQGCSDKIVKQSAERDDPVSRLQMEQIRLVGVEQTLRRELESCRQELESLRHENICLLDRLQSGSGCGFSFRLEQELLSRVECLQNQGVSLLHENNELCGKLLELVRIQQFKGDEEIDNEFDGYHVVEYDMKFHSLKRGVENLKRSLRTMSVVLDEKSQEASECQSQATESFSSNQLKNQSSEDDLQLELKAETLLTRVLREKLCSKELELEQLQGDLASSIRGHEVLRSEIQRLQDELSSLTHRARDMELQMLRKDENINQLEHDLEECMKELNVSRGILPKVSEERDRLWEEVKCLKEKDMFLKYEVDSLKKKIEALEEEILVKEGQITILKDSIVKKPFDILNTPKSLKEYALE